MQILAEPLSLFIWGIALLVMSNGLRSLLQADRQVREGRLQIQTAQVRRAA